MVTDNQVIFRLFLSALLSGLVGFERESHGRVAGLRTHILVGIGSALIMLTSMYIFDIYRGVVSLDPARIAAGVVTGIGFLGAGTIIRYRASVMGLTTAASLWAVAGTGLAIGCGFYSGAYTTTILVLVTLFFLTKLERSFIRKDWYKTILIDTKGEAQQLVDIRSVLLDYNVEIKDFELRKTETKKNFLLEMDLKLLTDKYNDQIISSVMRIDGVDKAKWV